MAPCKYTVDSIGTPDAIFQICGPCRYILYQHKFLLPAVFTSFSHRIGYLLLEMSCHWDGGRYQGDTRHSVPLARRQGGFNLDV